MARRPHPNRFLASPGQAAVLAFVALSFAGIAAVAGLALYANDVDRRRTYIQPTAVQLRPPAQECVFECSPWPGGSIVPINSTHNYLFNSQFIEPATPTGSICGLLVSKSFIAGKTCEADPLGLANVQHWFVITADAPTTVERFVFEPEWRARAERLLEADLHRGEDPTTAR